MIFCVIDMPQVARALDSLPQRKTNTFLSLKSDGKPAPKCLLIISGHFGGGFSLHFKERKAEGFSQNHAMQFGKVPTLKEGGAESRVNQIFAGNACAIFYVCALTGP